MKKYKDTPPLTAKQISRLKPGDRLRSFQGSLGRVAAIFDDRIKTRKRPMRIYIVSLYPMKMDGYQCFTEAEMRRFHSE